MYDTRAHLQQQPPTFDTYIRTRCATKSLPGVKHAKITRADSASFSALCRLPRLRYGAEDATLHWIGALGTSPITTLRRCGRHNEGRLWVVGGR